ncbi:uncharacterized protein LOC143183151 [Calliopsis andreniformis]|uniref:uncharacterized protein LOC143183151 n=1 Tax=Calliopsis andreniformis TaxID=337506 RepID=UPI003FCEC9C6
MENLSSICMQTLINNITLYLSSNICENISIIKISNDNLSANGELYFLPSLKVWRKVLQDGNACSGKCTTILQHFLHVHGDEIDGKTDINIANEVLQSLISSSYNWSIKIERYALEKERVCLFLYRVPLIANSIKAVITRKHDFGKTLSINKVFSFKIHQDKKSELTTARLRLIQSVTEKILSLHGCNMCEEDSDLKFIFTTKSQGIVEENYTKYVCGVVKNLESNTKETTLTWEEHINNKINGLREVNEEKYFEIHEQNVQTEDSFHINVAEAIAKFELLSIKPSRPVFIGCNVSSDKNTTNMKGASFILYNIVRIKAIMEKYNQKRLAGEYPDLPNVDDVDFSLLNTEEEWELVYNFIIGYQQMIKSCLRHEVNFQTNPQVICIFLSTLCQKFSVYYHRVRILTEAYDHLIPTVIARLYMLQALEILLQNALLLLDIVPVSRM